MGHLAVGAEGTVGNEAKAAHWARGIQCGLQDTPDCCHYKQPQPGRGCVLEGCVTGPKR